MASKTSPKIDFILVALGGIVSINLVSILGISFLNLWIRLCSPLLNHPSFLNKALLTIVISVIGLSQSSIVLGLIFSGVEPHWISLLSYSSLGVLILLTTATVFSDLVTCTFGLLNSRSCPSPSRAQYARSQIIAIVLVTALFTALALHNGLKEPLVKQVNIPIKNLPAEFHGFTIVHLPDLHVGPTIGKTMLEKVVKTTNTLNPDAITIAGDLVDATVFQIRQAVKPLLKLRARYGVYFVTGNHEYYTGDVDGWLKELEYLGVTPLHNSHVLLTHPNKNQAKLCLSGVDDSEGGFLRSGNHGTDIIQALKGVDAGTPTILLAHRPKAARLVLDSHKVDLILTGHTHGGQLFPIHLWHLIREPYFAGLYRHNTGSHVYVSSGVHFWGMPMRLWSEAEITYIVLISSEK